MTDTEPLSNLIARLRSLLPVEPPSDYLHVSESGEVLRSEESSAHIAIPVDDLSRLLGAVERLREERDNDRARLITRVAQHCHVTKQWENALYERDALREDVRRAASELLVNMDEAHPGSTVARLLIANRIMHRERDESRAEIERIRAGSMNVSDPRAL